MRVGPKALVGLGLPASFRPFADLSQEAPYVAEIQMGAQLILDFQGARSGRRPYYWYRGTRYTDPRKIPGWSFTRASTALAEDSAGNLIAFAANEPRITDRGLLIEEARTNYVWNNVMAGAVVGSPGAAPTYWVTSGSAPAAAGLTQTISSGVENGLAYLEITLAGTPTITGGSGYYFTGTNDKVPTSPGQTWTASTYARLIGAATGVTSFTLGIVERDTGGAPTESSSTTMVLGTAMARFTHTRTMAGGATVKAQANANVNFTSGVPLNVTYRLYAPQMEQGGFATSPILTGTGVVTRAADNAYITGLGALLAAPFTVAAWADLPSGAAVLRRLVELNDQSSSNRMNLTREVNNSARLVAVAGGVTQNSAYSGGVFTGDVRLKYAARLRAATYRAALNGAIPAGEVAYTPPVGLSRLDLGYSSVAAAAPLNGYISRVIILGDVTDAALQALTA